MAACCNGGTFQNTGVPLNQKGLGDAVALFLVPTVNSTGEDNFILNTDVLDDTFFNSKIYAENPQDRWFRVGTFNNVIDTREDSVTETFSEGNSAFVRQGVRIFTGELVNYSPVYQGVLNSFRCSGYSVYGVNKCGGLIGTKGSDGTKLYPTRAFSPSTDSTFVKATNEVTGKVMFKFEYDQTELDSNLRLVTSDNIDSDLIRISSPVTIDGTISGIVATGFDVALTLDYDEAFTGEPVTGFVLADFTLFNVTTNSSIAITSVTESALGTYTFVIPPQTAGDELRLFAVKNSKMLEYTYLIAV